MNAHGLFFTNFLLYLSDILPFFGGKSDIIRVRISGESDTTYLSFSFSLN